MPRPSRSRTGQEDYPQAVYSVFLEKRRPEPRRLPRGLFDVRASSVTKALHIHFSPGLITYAPYELITLKDAGIMSAGEIVGRHEVEITYLSPFVKANRSKLIRRQAQ